MSDYLLEDIELLFDRLELPGDIDDFTHATVVMVKQLSMPRSDSPPAPSKLDAKRKKALKALRSMDEALAHHVREQIVVMLGSPPSGSVEPLHQVLAALATPFDTNRASDRQLAAAALLWHCREWGLSFPDGFVALATELKPAVPAIGDPYKLCDLAKQYKNAVFANTC